MSRCTLIGTVVAKNETREELRRILSAMVAPTRAEAGCINYDFHVDAEDPNLAPLVGRLDELLARPVEMRFVEMLSEPAA